MRFDEKRESAGLDLKDTSSPSTHSTPGSIPRVETPKEVDIVIDEDSTGYSLVVRLHGEIDTCVPLSTVVGIRFEIRHEKLRDEVDGRMVIVTRTHAVGCRQWASWIYFLIFLLATAFTVHDLVGPFTAFIALLVWALSVSRSFFSAGANSERRHRRRRRKRPKANLPNRFVSPSPADSPRLSAVNSPHSLRSEHSPLPKNFFFSRSLFPPPRGLATTNGYTLSPLFHHLGKKPKIPYFLTAKAIDDLLPMANMPSFHQGPTAHTTPSTLVELSELIEEPQHPLVSIQKDTRINRRATMIRNFGPDRVGVPLGPLINWSGQLSVFYILMWRLPHLFTLQPDRNFVGFVFITLALIRHRNSLSTIWVDDKAWNEGLAVGPFGSIRLYRPPVPTFPIRIVYSQAEIPKLLEIRSAVLNIPAGRETVRDVAVGGYWTEGITSALLPSRLYNSRLLRQLGHIAINFLVPAFFILQGFSVLLPWAWGHIQRISALLGEDLGLHAIKSFLIAARSVGGRVLTSLSFMLPNLAELFSRLAFPLRMVASFFSWIVRSFMQVLWDYIVPSDAFLTYARARFAELQSLATPAFNLAARLSNSLAAFLRFLTAPLVSLVQIGRALASTLAQISTGVMRVLLAAVGPLISAGLSILGAAVEPLRVIFQGLYSLLQAGFRVTSTLFSALLTILRTAFGVVAVLCDALVSLLTAALGLVRALALRVPGLAKFAKQIGDQMILLQKRDPLFWYRMRATAVLSVLGLIWMLTAVLLSPVVAVTVTVATMVPFLISPSLQLWLKKISERLYPRPNPKTPNPTKYNSPHTSKYKQVKVMPPLELKNSNSRTVSEATLDSLPESSQLRRLSLSDERRRCSSSPLLSQFQSDKAAH
ncbi:hypothetical protein AAMO2058_000491300 [Amorphochlora amoebiformis]